MPARPRAADDTFTYGSGNYMDRGCPAVGGCKRSLKCPYETCIYDMNWWQRHKKTGISERDTAIAALYHRGFRIVTLSELVGVSERSINRVIQRVRNA